MRCSIVIPAYNASRFLSATIESALAQIELDDFELIIVDDGSTDETTVVASQFAASHPAIVRVIRTTNQGVGAARNVGLANARFDFIQFLDADDLIFADKIAIQIKEMYDTKSDFSLSGGIEIDESGRVVGVIDLNSYLISGLSISGRMILGGFFPPVAPLLKTEKCRRIGGFSESRHMSGYADYEFFCRYLFHFQSTSKISERPLFSYRTHIGSMSADVAFMDRARRLAFESLCAQHATNVMESLDELSRSLSDLLYANRYLNESIQRQQVTRGYVKADVLTNFISALKSARISIWGCGNGGFRVAELVAMFGGSIVAAFDASASKLGSNFFGVCVQNGLLSQVPKDSVVLVCTQFDVTQLMRDMESQGLTALRVDFELIVPILEAHA